jgi:anti-sigma factor RsiW
VTCPELVLLSQLLDGEAVPADVAPVRAHVATCAACRNRLERLDRATRRAHLALAANEPQGLPAAPRPECLAPVQVAGWAARALPAGDLRAVESHLERCDACLDDALAAIRLMATLEAGPMAAVPAALRARVASRWTAVPAADSLTAVVIQVARAGVRLLERHVVAPILAVEDLLVPAPAFRAGEGTDTVSFRIRAPEAQICATIVPEGAAVGLDLTLLGAADAPLGGQRVFLRRHGRSIYSARTDGAGTLRMPRIEPGVYEVSCPGIATSFRLELRP